MALRTRPTSLLRTWRRIAWGYFVLFAIGVTWPVQALVNDPEVLVFGLPIQMAWTVGWLLGGLLVLWRLEAARHEGRSGRDGTGGSAASTATGE